MVFAMPKSCAPARRRPHFYSGHNGAGKERKRQIAESRVDNIKLHGGDLGVFIDYVLTSQSPIEGI